MDATSRRLIVPTIALLLLAGLTGCTSAGASADSLAGRTFLSGAVTEGGVARTLVPGTQIRLSFGSDRNLGVSASCNSMGATYRVENGVLRTDRAAITEMGCDQDRMAQDDWVFAFMGSGPTVVLSGDSLTLARGNTVVVLIDKEVAEPDLPLVGPTWTVHSIIDGDAVSSTPDGVVTTLRFGSAGRVDVATGCNQGNGRFALDGATLRVSKLVLTKRACADPTRRIESAVLAVLGSGSISVRIDASDLTLMAGSSGLGLGGR